jgi:DNA-directed RNA polymerase subunit E'
MYKKMKLEGIVRIPPNDLGNPLEEAVAKELRNKYEAVVDKTLGTIVAVLGADKIGEGRILAGDGAVYYDVIFDAIVFKPEMQEIIEGEVVEIVKFGAFLSLGPFDGLLHVSQITNEYISYDEKNARLVSKESNKSLNEGDRLRVRIIAISLNEKEPRESKIGLTMRQTGLGKLEWLEAERNTEVKARAKTEPKLDVKTNIKGEEKPKSRKKANAINDYRQGKGDTDAKIVTNGEMIDLPEKRTEIEASIKGEIKTDMNPEAK